MERSTWWRSTHVCSMVSATLSASSGASPLRGWAQVLSHPGGREATLLHEGGGAWTWRPRRAAHAWGAMAKLARLLKRLDRRRLPVHVTPVARRFLETMSHASPFPTGTILRGLLDPRLTDRTLDLLRSKGRVFDPMLHNTVNATIVRGGEKINVIPSEVMVEMDGRLLPGYTPTDMISELRRLVGDDVEFEVISHDPGPSEPDMGLFDTLAGILREADPEGIPVPLLIPAFTDARFFSRLGIQTYGFLPMKLPAGFNFNETIHAADERIPAEALSFGADAIYKALQRFGPT